MRTPRVPKVTHRQSRRPCFVFDAWPRVVALLLALAAAKEVRAAGYDLYEESPAGTAMVGALTAVPGDASAIFYNPAGLALQRGGSVLVSGSIGFASTSVTSQDGIKTDAQMQAIPIPHVYGFSHIGSRVAAGVGMFTQFGNGMRWEDQGTASNGMKVPFPGRFIATDTQLQTATINPSVAILATDRLSIGGGLDVVIAQAELRRQLQLGDFEGSAHLGGTATAVGGNIGVLAILIPHRLNAGISYRSATSSLNFNLDAHFGVPPELASTVKDQPAKLSLPLPHNFSAGVAVMPIDSLTLTADVHVTFWSDFQTLEATFPTTSTPPLSSPRNWRDTVSARLAGELMATRGLALRLGFGYDQTPVPASTLDTTIPVSDRWLITGGLGYTVPSGRLHGLGVAAGYLVGISANRTSTLPDFPNAVYGQTVHLVTVGVSYAWGTGCEGCCGPEGCTGCQHCGSVSQQ